MNELLPLLLTRRSVRRYTGDPIPPETLRAVVTAGLLSPSSRNRRPWRLVVVQDRATLEALSHCRQGSAQMLARAGAAILVFARPAESDVWTEDCSILMSNLHLAAHSQGLGSCWIQGRLRQAEDGRTTEAFCRERLALPEDWALEAILSLGIPVESPPPHTLEEADWGKVTFL